MLGTSKYLLAIAKSLAYKFSTNRAPISSLFPYSGSVMLPQMQCDKANTEENNSTPLGQYEMSTLSNSR